MNPGTSQEVARNYFKIHKMHLWDKSDKPHVDESPPLQIDDVSIDSLCSVVVTDSENTDKTSDRSKTNSSVCSPNFYRRYKCIFLATAGCIVLIEILLRLMFIMMFTYEIHDSSARIQPESRMERVIRQNYPLARRSLSEAKMEKVIDEDSSFSDQTELANQITRVAGNDAFSTINGGDAGMRSKREISRERRDCDQNLEHCKVLLQKIYDFASLNSKFSGKNPASVYKDILKCLKCKKLQSIDEYIADEYNKESALQSKDQYYPHEYVEQNYSNNPSIPPIIELLDNEVSIDGPKRTEVNRTEAPKIQVTKTDSVIGDASQDAANRSSKHSIEAITIAIDHTQSNGNEYTYVNITDINKNSTASINDKKQDSNLIANVKNDSLMHITDINKNSTASMNDKKQDSNSIANMKNDSFVHITDINKNSTASINDKQQNGNSIVNVKNDSRMNVTNINDNSMPSINEKGQGGNPIANLKNDSYINITDINKNSTASVNDKEQSGNPIANIKNDSHINITDINKNSTASVNDKEQSGNRIANMKNNLRINITDINENAIASVNDKQQSDPITIDKNNLYTTKIQSNMSVHAESNVDEGHHDKIKGITSDVIALLKFTTTESSHTTAQYNIVTANDIVPKETTADSVRSTEMGGSIDLTKQIAITENVSVSTGYNVTGIDGINGIDGTNGRTAHPSVSPSFEGHPENKSAAAMNESKLTETYRSFNDGIMSANDYQLNNMKPFPEIAENTKSYQQLQMKPASWMMPYPVCFLGHPGQISNRQLPSGPAFYPTSSGPSSPQNYGFPFSNPSHQSSSMPNYIQVQANTVQFLPRSSHVNNPMQSLTTGQGVGPTGSAMSNMPIFSLNEQPVALTQRPTTMVQQSAADTPFFCTYMMLPRLHMSPGTLPSDRSSATTKDLQGTLYQSFSINNTDPKKDLSSEGCLENQHQCNDKHCIPKLKWCDGHVDCFDASDETSCSCIDRIAHERICDGFFDCPHGEDELGCFNCPENYFTCDKWDPSNAGCIPYSQRCDGISQCESSKDEMECTLLSDVELDQADRFSIGYLEGYLHKNFRGKWYPVCSMENLWAEDACLMQLDSLVTKPDVQIVATNNSFQGPFVKSENGNEAVITQNNECLGIATYVKCSGVTCGTNTYWHNSIVANKRRNYNMYKSHLDEQSDIHTTDTHKLYWETLGLLEPNNLTFEEKTQDQNNTFVGSQMRVVGGRASHPGSWPFLVAIYRDGYFHCGGVIVNNSFVLTAAHCMEGFTKYYYEVQAGILRQLSFSPMVQSRRVRYVIIHPSFEDDEMQGDVAIIMLDRPFFYNEWVRQVCLPDFLCMGERFEGPRAGSTCLAIGWGALTENGPDADHLREVEVPILPTCKYLPDQNDATICAGYNEGGRDACQGDSGGPLMCRHANEMWKWYIGGIISHGDGCARPGEPGVYMRVSSFLSWIQDTIKALNIGTLVPGNEALKSCPGFSCETGTRKCLPKTSRCDRIVECLNAEDEIGCSFQSNQYYNYTSYKQHSDAKIIKLPTNEASNGTRQYKMQRQNNKNSNTMNIKKMMYITNNEVMSSIRLTFTCKSLIQTITINKKCDRHLDCEDGSDEDNCTCKDYLSNFEPTAICDGHLDCADETDEKNCGICKDDQFKCSRSGTCIPINKKCDGNLDCPFKEDEMDCFALTNGEYIDIDGDNRTALNIEGLLGRYYDGTWNTQCVEPAMLNDTAMSIIGQNICKYIGFANPLSVDKVHLKKKMLKIRPWKKNNASNYESSTSDVELDAILVRRKCMALRIRCRPVLSSSAESHMIADPKTGSYTYLWPWLAAIFVDGRYRCSALLLEPDWLLSTLSCAKDIKLSVNYTVALLGQSRSYLYVDGPYQQISVVDDIRHVYASDISLLHLKTAVNFTRYVQPLFLEKKIYPPSENQLCVAVGTDKEHVTKTILLKSVLQNCDKCYRCFVGESRLKCPANVNSSDWSGSVFCHDKNGWYPAAIFHEFNGLCSFQNVRNLTSINTIYAYITQVIGSTLHPTLKPKCNGFRCNIGQCIPMKHVCDDVMHCRDGADENSEMCMHNMKMKNNNTTQKCRQSELRCRNGQCVPKSAFCDNTKVDCMDGTDEPVKCTCAEYLKLTSPERICDGVRHCLDKTDESPEMCHCTETSFKCNAESKNVTCISQDFVCDGDKDCPNGEDEKECKKLKLSTNNRPGTGEVIQRSYGVWHSQCFSSPVTSQDEAKAECQKIGYKDGIIDNESQVLSKPIVASRDDFYMIRLNANMWIIMRNDKPLITLVPPEEPCHRLFVKCN